MRLSRSTLFLLAFSTGCAGSRPGDAAKASCPCETAKDAGAKSADSEFESMWNISLTNEGAAPRAPLRYTLSSNAPASVTIEDVTDVKMMMNMHVATKLAFSIGVDPPGGDPARPWAGSYVPHSASIEPSDRPDNVERMKRFASLGNRKGEAYFMNRGGWVAGVLLDEHGKPSAEIDSVTIPEYFPYFAVPLPSEPIGAGAKWTARQIARGWPGPLTYGCELKPREGAASVVACTIERPDNYQDVPSPRQIGGQTVRMKTEQRGEGTWRIEEGRFVPEATVKLRMVHQSAFVNSGEMDAGFRMPDVSTEMTRVISVHR
jgi:hypothetical protein